ncbi:MAG: hypothetical protein R2877_01195 [Bdellovibrionota bacterium]
MWSYIHKHFKGKRVTALVVVISMLLPMVSWASNESPAQISAAQEKEFLKLFETYKDSILREIENHNATDESGDLVWVYQHPKIEGIRFMMKQNEHETFNLFAQEKKFARTITNPSPGYTRMVIDRNKIVWSNKFNGQPLGEVDYKIAFRI